MEVNAGQALVEGIAIRGERARVAAVRGPTGLVIASGGVPSPLPPFARVLRSWFGLVGTEMQWAADVFEGRVTKTLPDDARRSPIRVVIGVVLAQAISVGLAFAIDRGDPFGFGCNALASAIVLVVGALYMIAISRVFPDIRRVFQYNAAFKMACWALRKGEEPSVECLRRQPTWDPRSSAITIAGAFVLIAPVPAIVPATLRHSLGDAAALATVIGLRALVYPFAVALVDESMRAATRLREGSARVLFFPLVLVDRLTVIAPDTEMLEVASAAASELRAAEQGD